LSNDLRNLLTEDSLNSIMSAGSAPNGHLMPTREEPAFSSNIKTSGGEELALTSKYQEKEVANYDGEIKSIKDYMKEQVSRHDEHLSAMTKKMNDVIKGVNEMEQKLTMLEKMSVVREQPEEVVDVQEKQQTLAPAQEVKEKEKVTHPRSLASLPAELSIENIFNCNGKTF